MSVHHVPNAHEGQKRALEPLEIKLTMVVSYPVCVGD